MTEITLIKDGEERKYSYIPETMQLAGSLIGIEYYLERGWEIKEKSDLKPNLNYDHLVEIAAHVCSKRHGCWLTCTKCLNRECFEKFVNSELNWNLIEKNCAR